MKNGISYQELKAAVHQQAEGKRDYLISTDQIELIWAGGQVAMATDYDNIPWRIADTAHRQIAEKLKIPTRYYFRMMEEAPDLLIENANHWLWRNPEPRMIRTIDRRARAFLSTRYQRWDNNLLIETLERTMPELDGGFTVASSQITESNLYIKAVTDRFEEEIRPGDPIQAGVTISTSEIGEGMLRIDPFILRLVCENGMTVQDPAFEKYHKRHLGAPRELEIAAGLLPQETIADNPEVWETVRRQIREAFEITTFDKAVEQLIRSAKTPLPADPEIMVREKLAKKHELTEKESGDVYYHLVAKQDYTQYGLINAITRASKDIEDYTRATELEALGGKLAALEPDRFKAIAA